MKISETDRNIQFHDKVFKAINNKNATEKCNNWISVELKQKCVAKIKQIKKQNLLCNKLKKLYLS